MNTWVLVAILLLCTLIGYLIGANLQKASDENSKVYGILWINKVDPEENGGVYLQSFEDPQIFEEGKFVQYRVMWYTEDISQQKQGQ